MSWDIQINHFRYSPDDEPILENVHFSITPGKVHHICGPSGCGKSTLLAILCGHLPEPESHAVIDACLDQFPSAGALRSAQDPFLQVAAATVIDELLLGPEYREHTPEKALTKALQTAREFRLTSLLEKDTSLLSFGQARLLGLATIWQYPSPLLLLDEPFVGLDSKTHAHFYEAITAIAASGCAVVLTHTRTLDDEVTIELKPCQGKAVTDCPDYSTELAQDALLMEQIHWQGWEGKTQPSLAVRPGELLLITGPNGSGKTQLLHHLAGMKSFISGKAEFSGSSTYMSQNPDQEIFAPDLMEEIMVGAKNSLAEALALVEYFELTPHQARSPLLLSYGQKKRVSFIGALMRRPSCLLLDEPLAGLDCRNRNRLLRLLRFFLDRGGIVLIATHEPEQFLEFSPSRLHLDPGNDGEDFSWERGPTNVPGVSSEKDSLPEVAA
ncbi:MAG: ATP-binding cassette domain-containing protein [Candidatus Ozemobacteraceae bacterium]